MPIHDCTSLRSSFFEFGKTLPHPREFDHQLLPRAKEINKKLSEWPGFTGSKKFPGGCTQLELTETLFIKSRMNMAKILQSPSCKVFSTMSTTWIINSSFWDTAIIHQQLVAMLRGHTRFVYGDKCYAKSPHALSNIFNQTRCPIGHKLDRVRP